ncbi:MAG TPA: hypothetical protein VI588_03265, partial [Candidatus Gracilibacteria bacterium]|nr:hypothetical protein [Candidatus Gracilibacteria bacterium]
PDTPDTLRQPQDESLQDRDAFLPVRDVVPRLALVLVDETRRREDAEMRVFHVGGRPLQLVRDGPVLDLPVVSPSLAPHGLTRLEDPVFRKTRLACSDDFAGRDLCCGSVQSTFRHLVVLLVRCKLLLRLKRKKVMGALYHAPYHGHVIKTYLQYQAWF